MIIEETDKDKIYWLEKESRYIYIQAFLVYI
jgi:hypothetical protein